MKNTPEKYSADWVREQAEKIGATWLGNHDCGMCREWVGYVIADDQVFYRSACGCSWTPDRPSSFEEIAQSLARQSSDEIRDRIMDKLS